MQGGGSTEASTSGTPLGASGAGASTSRTLVEKGVVDEMEQ